MDFQTATGPIEGLYVPPVASSFQYAAVVPEGVPPPPDIAAAPIWITWAYVQEGKRRKKMPRSIPGGASTTVDRLTADTYAKAYAIAAATGASVGCVLGSALPDGRIPIGLDIDACRDATTGAIAPWAKEILSDWRCYTEVSPSLTGIKLFTAVSTEAHATIKAAIVKSRGGHGSENTRTWAWKGDDHPPGLQFYIAGRWFAYTGWHLTDTPREW